MSKEPPTFGRNKTFSVAQMLAELKAIDDIDDMLREGVSTGDVAKFIQLGLQEMVDVNPKTLGKELGRRRSRIGATPQVILDDRLAAIMPAKGRKVAQMARNKYLQTTRAIDRLIELECSYLAQRDRIDTMIEMEQNLGFPFEMTGREFLVAAKILEQHRKEESELLERMGAGPSHEALDIRGYSKETSETLRKPDSRRRVVSIVERLKRVKGGVDIPELKEASSEK